MTNSQEDLLSLELMARNEENVARLYQVYEKKFPAYKKFWGDLAVEEDEHAEIIRGIITHIENKTVFLKEQRFNKEAIRSFLRYLKEEVEKAETRQISLINALSIALHIEKSLIERKYFEIFEGDDINLKHLLRDLRTATQKHIKKVEATWNSERQKASV